MNPFGVRRASIGHILNPVKRSLYKTMTRCIQTRHRATGAPLALTVARMQDGLSILRCQLRGRQSTRGGLAFSLDTPISLDYSDVQFVLQNCQTIFISSV
jgi:hypothetical protein